MIGFLNGVLFGKVFPLILVDVRGVGYELEVSVDTYNHLPQLGKLASFYTHFIVREESQFLYGFLTLEERNLFRVLIKVNSVGPKLALSILSKITVYDFITCIQENNKR